LMKDVLDYGVTFGFLGKRANTIFIKGQIKEIFRYRKEVTDKIFS